MKDIKKRSGCAVGTVVLALITLPVLLLAVGGLLMLSLRIFYMSMRRGRLIDMDFRDEIVYEVWHLAFPLVALNLAWMIYGLCCWRTRHLKEELMPEQANEESPTGFKRPVGGTIHAP